MTEELRKDVERAIKAYNEATDEAEKESYLEFFTCDLALIEELIVIINELRADCS